MTVWASRKELSSKVDGFHKGENPSPIAGIKDSLKKYVSTRRKNCFIWQKNRKWLPLGGKYFSVKMDSS